MQPHMDDDYDEKLFSYHMIYEQSQRLSDFIIHAWLTSLVLSYKHSSRLIHTLQSMTEKNCISKQKHKDPNLQNVMFEILFWLMSELR